MTIDHPTTDRPGPVSVADRRMRRVRSYLVREMPAGGDAPRVARLTLVRANPRTEGRELLLVDHHPIPARNWGWDRRANRLHWSYGTGAHHLAGGVEFTPDGLTGYGSTTVGDRTSPVEVTLAPIEYTCDLAADAGAYYNTATHALTWPAPDSSKWTAATWVDRALRFGYDITAAPAVGAPQYDVRVAFADLQTGVDWTPDVGDFSYLVNGDLRFTFTAYPYVEPPEDDRSGLPAPASGIQSVLPYEMAFDFDPFGDSITGAVRTGTNPATGVYAVRGVADNSATIGMYRLRRPDGRWIAVGLGAGELVVDERPVAVLHRRGDTVSWRGLDRAAAIATGLPPAGTWFFSPDGARVLSGTGIAAGHRTSYESLAGHREALAGQPGTAKRARRVAARRAPNLSVDELAGFTQFRKDDKGRWIDRVQDLAGQDFYKILLYQMDKDLRETYLTSNKVDLDPALKQIADLPGKDGTKAKGWYETLSIAYLTQALARTEDPDAAKLNDRKAQAWLKEAVSQATVYQAQAPEMYTRRYVELNPDVDDYLIDQYANYEAYEAVIEADSQAWIAQVRATVANTEDAPDRVEDLVETIERLAEVGKDGRYWAYKLLRHATSPAALRLLELMSLNGSYLDGSEYTRRIQTNVATLGVLDPSGSFVHEYANIIQLFQLTNVLPKLIDYAGNVDTFSYAVEEILKQFVTMYVDSPDPAIQDMLTQFQEALDHNWTREVLDGFANLASTFAGVYSWEQVAAKFEREWPKMSKIPLGAAKLITLAGCSAGTAAFVFGVMNWQDVKDPMERTQLIVGGLDVFVQMSTALVKRGVAYAKVLGTDGVTWANLWKTFKGDALRLAEGRMNTGVSRWLIQAGRVEIQASEQFGTLFMQAGEYEQTMMTKLLGRNLDEFVATRLGAALAIINIVLSAIAIANSTSEMDTIANSLFLGSAALELFAIAGGWVLGYFGVATIGGFAVASIAAAMTAVAAFAAIAGVVLILIMLFGPKPKSAVNQFATGAADKAGYYMPHGTAVEYFRVAEPAKGRPQLVGAALRFGERYLTMNADGSVTLGGLDRTSATCFYLTTDVQGRARFTATLRARPADRLLTSYCLTYVDGRLAASPATAAGQGQWWRAEVLSTSGTGPDGRPESAEFALSMPDGSGGWRYLAEVNGGVGMVGDRRGWWLKMESTQPGALTMQDLTLYTYQNDGRFGPALGEPGSMPRTFELSEPPPDFLVFNPETGQLSWKTPGEYPPVMARRSYRIGVRNEVAAAEPVTFTIEVRPQDAGAAAVG
ncbi:hypothetical protein [Polymorphospora sp. NPDC050346]|uniref:hypothetical protein n=1 Tax=Polymorphospora sp. NPDC050346 TaxID=3155780 RepID=UPI0033E03718